MRGRRKQNELLLHLDIANGSRDKYELVVYENESLSPGAFEQFKEEKERQGHLYDPIRPGLLGRIQHHGTEFGPAAICCGKKQVRGNGYLTPE